MDNQQQQHQQQPYFYGRRPALRRQTSSSSSCAETLPTASVTSSLSSLDEQEVASSLASSPLPMAATFRSMRITRQYQGAPPLLAAPASSHQASNTKVAPVGATNSMTTSPRTHETTSAETATNTTSETVDPASIMGTIPALSPIHILERTAVQIPLATTNLETVLQRIFDYLRHHSMTYQCDKDTGCLDCMSMEQGVVVGFVVQLWRRPSNHEITLEVQRRQGCSIEMNSIRRSLIQYVLHGGESQPLSSSQQNQTKMPSSWMQVDPTAFHKNASTTTGCRRRSLAGMDWNECSSFGSNKRPKTPAWAVAASPNTNSTATVTTIGSTTAAATTATTSSIDNALAITVRLLESSRRDEQQLGFESLIIMTNPHYGVQYNDAMAVSRAFIKGEGNLGSRLQQRVASLLQQVKPPSNNRHNKAHGIMFDSAAASQDYQPGSMSAILYNLALQALVNGLDQVTSQHNANSKNSAGLDAKSSQPDVLIDLNSMFWQAVVQCLLSSLEDAASRPHEAALSAKCIRFLLSAGPGAPFLPAFSASQHQTQPQPLMSPQPAAATQSQQQQQQFQHFDGSTMQAILRRAHAFGKTHHLFLELESQRLMGKCNNRSWAHAA